ncbi:hypothetical protein MCUN1_003393 [Malassezia cuniculi]|uniref:Peptidase M20 dimerisation domain-containing protein n=1 Tax=Malassezia cuniculi TaxID=948313 RepID=A0AAF0J7Y1_9BASI|nr:hypothetical protein MCUN1_003393 [Malassezia cuniculi]
MADAPNPHHTISVHKSPVLSLAADRERGHLFAGTLSGTIYVWDIVTQQEKAQFVGHTRSVLAMVVAPSRNLLFSSSCDSTVRVWDTHTLQPLALIYPASDNVGDILSLAWCDDEMTLYLGCQNTSIQWIHLGNAWDAQQTPRRESRPHKFFDSQSLAQRLEAQASPGAPNAEMLVRRTAVLKPDGTHIDTAAPLRVLSVDHEAVALSAHYGYIYSLTLLKNGDAKPLLASGAGDGCVRLWTISSSGLLPLTTLSPPGDHAVLALASWHNTLFVGRQQGPIQVWDLSSRSLIRTLSGHSDDVLSLQVIGDQGDMPELYSTGADGRVCHWDRYFRLYESWMAHQECVQTSAWLPPHGKNISWLASAPMLATGGSDAQVRLWEYVEPPQAPSLSDQSAADEPLLCAAQFRADAQHENARAQGPETTSTVPDSLLARLARFVHFRSVSQASPRQDTTFSEDSRRAAHYLRDVLQDLGASDVQLLSSGSGLNPLVLGTFRGSRAPGRRRCLFYGHYDCVNAHGDWDSDPWVLTGRDGYVYGRGVSDNKGPILAVAHAASELLHADLLNMDVVMLIEGEQETGSRGFAETLRAHRDAIGPVDVVLLSNSYWIGEDRPCVTVGLRGVVHASVRITSQRPDRHSGVEGGAETEPMMEMVKVLAALTRNDGRVALEGFYDGVRDVSPRELEYYAELAKIQHAPARTAEGLKALWRMPSLSVHKVTNSGGSSIIANSVEAALSMRIVPDQDVEEIAALLRKGLEESFAALHSVNHLEVKVFNRADWWLGKLDAPYMRALAQSVEDEWGVAPLHIHEGGSIPGVAILEKELGAQAVHLPMGQSSDHAHLPNERIRLLNLEVRARPANQRGQAVIRRFFVALSQTGS